jgi:predicted permease
MLASLRRFLIRLVVAFRPNRAEDDLAREMRAHLALMEDDFRSSGLDAEAARLAARRAFGGVERAKELQRDARAFRWIDDARRDVLYACRTLARTPAFAAVAVTTLALGIGATTAVFTLFDAVLLKPLAVDRPDELRVVRQVQEISGGRIAKDSTYVPHKWFVDLRPRPEVFSEVMAFAESRDALLTANGRERRLNGGGLFVSDNYFALLGVRPTLGRTFVSGEPGASERAAVLGYACWLREFGGARDVIGKQILFNGAAFTIVGVNPSTFSGLELGQVPDVFLPLETMADAQPAVVALSNRANWSVQVVGRLQPGTIDTVAGERLTAFRDFIEQPKGVAARHVLQVLPLDTGLSDVRARFARPLSLLLGMGSLLLLIACANVATLLGARAASRRPEIVIRTAVGAGKSRLVRQLLTETLVLAAVAGSLGALCGSWATRILLGLLPQDGGPLQIDVAMDRRVLLFAVAISLLTAMVAGVAPAVRSLGFDLASALRDRSRGGAGGASRGRPFAVIQVALSVVLVVASTMFARTVYNLASVDPGFNPEHLIQVFVAPGERQYEGPQIERYYRAVFERLRAVPGVRAVTSSQMSLLERAKTTGTVAVAGFVPRSDEEREAQVFQVGPAFFETTGMAIVRGRDFSDRDLAGAQKVAAINAVAARRFFGTDDPIGRTVSSGGTYQIVAVVQGAKYNSLREEEPPVLFVPYTTVRTRPRMTFLVRTDETSEESVIRLVGAAARGGDPLIPLDVTPMTTFVGRSMAQERLLAALSIVFASVALLLLSIGLYGIMTFWVTERMPEIGIHLALGARLSQVRWVVIRQPLRLACMGIAVGLPAALAGSRAVDSLMFGVGPRDPVTIVAAVLVILVVTIVACFPTARRAARVDPMTALRCE